MYFVLNVLKVGDEIQKKNVLNVQNRQQIPTVEKTIGHYALQ